jgi:hypothetical protein
MAVVVCCGEKLREFALTSKKVVLTKITPCTVDDGNYCVWVNL